MFMQYYEKDTSFSSNINCSYFQTEGISQDSVYLFKG